MQLQHHYEEGQQTVLSTAPAANESILQAPNAEEEEAQVVASQPVTDLLATADQETAHGKWGMLLGMIVGALVALIAVFPHSPAAIFSYGPIVFLFSFIAATCALRYHRTTQALAQMDDVRMVGPLIDRLHTERRIGIRTRRVIRKALIRLLPRLKASDTGLLTPSQKGRLARHLAQLARFQQDKEFHVVILRALQQIGDAQAIPVVENIIRHRPCWAGQDQVHAEAVECLPFLLQRAQEENVRDTLLRATSHEAIRGQLLRPAEGVVEVSAHDLLRADSFPQRTSPQIDERD
jgi:hypothetical protein